MVGVTFITLYYFIIIIFDNIFAFFRKLDTSLANSNMSNSGWNDQVLFFKMTNNINRENRARQVFKFLPWDHF